MLRENAPLRPQLLDRPHYHYHRPLQQHIQWKDLAHDHKLSRIRMGYCARFQGSDERSANVDYAKRDP